MDFNNQNVSIFSCQFEAYVEKAKVQIKFPCNYFLQWKANNNKVIVSSQNRYQASKSQIVFNETLTINVNILYDKVNQKYLKKESLLMINLISKSRPDQIKLVGRVSIDLAEVLNENSFEKLSTSQLQYCSVEASLNFLVKSISIKESALHVSELDRSSFNQYMSFQANLKPHQGFIARNEGSSTYRDFDDDKSGKGSQQRQIRSLGRDKNKMSSPSLSKQVYTPNNRPPVITLQQQNKINRSNSIPNKFQNTKKFFSPKTNQCPIENESNFSFHKNTQDNSMKCKTSTPQLQDNQCRQWMSVKLPRQEVVLQKQLISQKSKNLSIKVQNQNLQSVSKTQRPSLVLSPKQIQLNQMKKSRLQDEAVSSRQAVIKKLELQIQAKRQGFQAQVPFISSLRQNNSKRFSMELSQTSQQSKRIIGLTQALNELQEKYTRLTLQTEEVRSSWKRQKQKLLNTITRSQNTLNLKERQIQEKNKTIELLQHKFQELQKSSNERLGQLIYTKSQLAESQKECQQFNQQKVQFEENLIKMQNELRHLHEQKSFGQDQINKNFADRLALYQQKMEQNQNKLLESQKERNKLTQKVNLLLSEQTQLSLRFQSLKQENKNYITQIQQSHNELFEMKEQSEGLKKGLQKKQKEIRQQKQKIWSSKDEELIYQINLKEQQVHTIREETQSRILKIQEETRNQIQSLKISEKNLKIKIEQLQNTIFRLSDQVSSYENDIKQLSDNVSLKQRELDQTSKQLIKISEEQRQMQGEHQDLLLSLNSQIQEHQARIRQLQLQIKGGNSALQQKDLQLLKCHQQVESHRIQLQLTKAQSTIYESKLLEQREYYEKQSQSQKVSYSQQVYQLEIQLQQQLDRYQELQHIKNLLKESLEDWQNKCTEDKIASSKAVARLNDSIKEKEQTMYEMENIMRNLEKEKQYIHGHLLQHHTQFTEVLNTYKLKQLQLRQLVQVQQSEFIKLYQAVKLQRTQLKQSISNKQKAIQQLQTNVHQSESKITGLNSAIESLRESLQTSQSSLIQLNSQSQSKIVELKNQHNQQVDEYEERIRQLQNIINHKDNQLLDKEMLIVEHQKDIINLKTEIEQFVHQATFAAQSQNQLNSQINILQQQIHALTSLNQSLELNLQQQSLKHTHLQNTLLEYEEKLGKEICQLNTQKQQILEKLTQSQQLSTEHVQSLKRMQEDFKLKQQQLQNQHLTALQKAKQVQKQYQSQLLHKIQSLQQEITQRNQSILQRTQRIEILSKEKSQLQRELKEIKTQRQTVAMTSYKQQIQKLKQQIKSLTQENLEVKSQLKQIPSLQRTIKIKTIQLNSLKYKSSANHSIDPDQVSHVEEIIRLKNEQIQVLKKENNNIKDLQLQLYQVQSLNEELYQNIEQYEEEKFHLNSELNEKQIKIAQLQQEVYTLATSKGQLKEKVHDLTQKIKYYENLILDFKGHQMSSTKSHSDKLNTSQMSSNKLINESQLQSNHKLQLDTFIKKIKLLELDLHKFKLKNQENSLKEQQYVNQIKQYGDKISQLEEFIKQKDIELAKKVSAPKSTLPSKPQVQYKNPQQVIQTFKQIQGLLKKRSEFHNLENTLINLHQVIKQDQIEHKQQDWDAKQKLANTNTQVNVLSKEFQNLKTKIMKLEGKNYQEKAKLISLLRPCEQSLKQVTRLYESNESSKHN